MPSPARSHYADIETLQTADANGGLFDSTMVSSPLNGRQIYAAG
jgi:hypothetical protein